jgi:predicted enzyme related to lactoylglutathione lyase
MPTAKHGKICYIEMPARDAQTSADFYQRAFGWTIRTRGDGAIAFETNGVTNRSLGLSVTIKRLPPILIMSGCEAQLPRCGG